MELFKRNHEQDPAKKPGSSAVEATSVRSRFRRLLGKRDGQSQPDARPAPSSASGGSRTREKAHRDGSIRILPNSDLLPDDANSHTTPSLWDRAYDTLKKDNPRLIEEYEELLTKEAQKTSSVLNNRPFGQAMPRHDVAHSTEGQSRQAQLDTIITQGLQRMEDKKTKYTIAGHEFVLGDQIAQAAELVLWAKDWVGEAVKDSPEASIAWAGVSIILPLLTNPKTAEEANRDGFAYVTTRMRYYAALEPLLQRLSKTSEVIDGVMAEANGHIAVLYQHILEFQFRSVLRFYQSRLGGYARDVFLPINWTQMRYHIEKLEATVNENLIQINAFAGRQALESLNKTSTESLGTIQQLLSVSEQQLRVAEAHRDIAQKQLEIQEDAAKQKLSDKQEECLQLFRITNSSKDATYEWYKDRVEDRVEQSCLWFLNHGHFQKWLEQESGPLLVTADPGCGKSVLAKFLIDHGLPRSTTICYFFFSGQDQNTVRQALCALLHQLFSQKPSLIAHATKQFSKDGRGLINSTKSLWTILGNAMQDPQAGSVTMVLDALDECAESDFENLVRNLESQFRCNQSTHGKLKYLLTSRPYERIVSKVRHLLDAFPYIRIPGEGEEESGIISREVNIVIAYRVDQLATEKGLSDQVKDELKKQLLEIPHRTYLWVSLVFDYLKTEGFKTTRQGVQLAAARMPKSVNEAYEKILTKAKEHPMVRKALSIILAASRPLTLSEMNVAVNVDGTSKSIHDLDLEKEEDFELRLRSWCGLFVSIHHQQVYFLHQTAREFLLADLTPPAAVPSELHWHNSITNRQAHAVLAEICVVYLDFLNYDDILPLHTSGKAGQDFNSYVFLDYSAKNWGTHFRAAGIIDDAAVVPSALRICDPDSKSYSSWFRIYWETTHRETPKFFSDLMVASYFGHNAVVKLLLDKDADIKANDSMYRRTPLSWAARNGHEEVVKKLLDKGAEVNWKDKNGQTPLSLAAWYGHKTVVKLLLAKDGIDLNSTDTQEGWTPLLGAISYGHEGVVKLLLAKDGIDPNSWQPVTFINPLSLALISGRKAIAELLLRKDGVNPNFKDRYDRTPLSIAAERGAEEVVKLLLMNNKVNPDARDSDFGQTPLSWAARLGHNRVVEILLEKDCVDPNSEDDYRQTPLWWAASYGRMRVVEVFLTNNRVDPDRKDIRGRTPLSIAATHGHVIVVKLLLAKDGVDPNSRDTEDRTPLSWAAENGYEEVVGLLLKDHGVDPGAKDKIGQSPLSLASKKGYTAVAELLLAKDGVDPNSRDNQDRTPLLWAVENGHEEVVGLLLNHDNINPDSKDSKDKTPLSWAAENGHEEVVGLLLAKDGVDPNSRDNQDRTPLSWAAEKGHEKVVGLLLAKDGVDPNSRDNQDRTPLSWAAENGHEKVVGLLLAKDDVDPNSKDSIYGGTPLLWATRDGFEAVWRLLEDIAGLEPTTPQLWRTHSQELREAMVKLLLANDKVNPNTKDSKGWSPLSWAAFLGNKMVVALMIANDGIEVNSEDNYYRTPLWWAVRNGHEMVADLLLGNSRVDPNHKDIDGRTPLSIAAAYGHFTVVKLLLTKDDVDLNSEDTEGRTPRWWATWNGHEAVVKLLLEHNADVK